jgi:hypothetical protein
MNTIKNSFTKIKASDEFKDKLFKELQAVSLDKKYSINNNTNNAKVTNSSDYRGENQSHIKIYYKQYIAAAAIFCVLIGVIGSKLALMGVQKENDNSEMIAYEPQTEPATGNDHLTINNKEESINNEIAPKADGSSNNIDKATKNNLHDSEIVESSKSYAKGETQKNTTEESKTSSTTNNDNTSKSNGNSNKTAVNKDATLNNEEHIKRSTIQEDKNSSQNQKTTANKPEAIEDSPKLASSIQENANYIETSSVNSIYIPKYEIPETVTFAARRMVPLIIYKGNIYLHSTTTIDSKDVTILIGHKLGTTQNTIDEWSSQKNYSIELASNIGVTDVYSVNGYDDGFRIMTNYKSEDGTNTADFYECLNGITISNGNDILSKLNLKGNIAKASYQSYSDWNNGTNIYHQIVNLNLLDDLFNEIDKGIPYLAENIEDTLGDYRNDEEYKELSLDLKDGTKNITLTILKSGYVSYGNPKIYFKISSSFTKDLWDKLNF